MQRSNELILEALDQARNLIILADEGESSARDDGCMLLFSIIRDCGYKIRQQAELERGKHISKGTWEEPETGSPAGGSYCI